MPRKKIATSKLAESTPSRRSNRHATKGDDVPEIYKEMLVEAAALSPLPPKNEGRAAKRRRVEESISRVEIPQFEAAPLGELEDDIEPQSHSVPPARAQQTIYDDFPSSEESDAAFEDVDLEPGLEHSDAEADANKPLQLDLSRHSGRAETPAVQRRKPATTAEKRVRLDVHKWHVLCLMLHGHARSRWCDREDVQVILKPLIPRKLITLLHLDESKPQYARNHAFNKAIEEISDIWQREWTITAKGMRRAFWTDDPDVVRDIDDLDDPINFDDFKEAAKALSGSRDVGAQLFCALLRSVAVDTRLVCSLQPLPFSGVAKGMTPEKPKPQYIYASNITHQTPQQGPSTTETIANPSNARWRASEHASEEYVAGPLPTTRPSPQKRIKDSPYPIFWTEVFSPSIDKWISVDPLVRHTLNKSRTGFEPPASDRLNSMSYVIAFEDDASARDVTRRYARQYNTKTRKLRVESTKGGDKWWKRTMAFFERPFPETRDEIEDNELAAREAQEGMPKNVGDFKGHPIFALERHLRRNEVIHPMREAGRVSAGAGGKAESVYRRGDVHVVRSADQWYRKGRDVKEGEQPLKRALPRRSSTTTPMDEYDVAEDGAGLYAEFQTDVYVPPPVVGGKVPRNVYGNLDVYVPSMIPAGAIHVQHPLAARSAKVLGVDYADAVTGFDFKGRQGTAVLNGIVAAAEYREAFVEVIREMEQEQAQAEQAKRTHLALQMWRRFMTALRIKEKIDKEYADDSSNEDMNDRAYEAPESSEEDVGGGFVPEVRVEELDEDRTEPQMAVPLHFVSDEVVVIESPHKLEKGKLQTNSLDAARIGSVVDENDAQEHGGGFITEGCSGDENHGRPAEQASDGEGGGFIPEQEANEGVGGFIPEQHAAEEHAAFIPDELLDDPKVPLAERRDTDHDGVFVLDAVDLGHGVKSPTAILPTTAASFNPFGIAASPPAAASTADGNSGAKTLEMPPPSAGEESTASVIHIASSRSPDSIDNESLLSHDPEDEDAEPEWLVDDEEL